MVTNPKNPPTTFEEYITFGLETDAKKKTLLQNIDIDDINTEAIWKHLNGQNVPNKKPVPVMRALSVNAETVFLKLPNIDIIKHNIKTDYFNNPDQCTRTQWKKCNLKDRNCDNFKKLLVFELASTAYIIKCVCRSVLEFGNYKLVVGLKTNLTGKYADDKDNLTFKFALKEDLPNNFSKHNLEFQFQPTKKKIKHQRKSIWKL
jgi:hypothetical protein